MTNFAWQVQPVIWDHLVYKTALALQQEWSYKAGNTVLIQSDRFIILRDHKQIFVCVCTCRHIVVHTNTHTHTHKHTHTHTYTHTHKHTHTHTHHRRETENHFIRYVDILTALYWSRRPKALCWAVDWSTTSICYNVRPVSINW